MAIFRYLLTQPHRAAHKDTLMELFWPDASPAEAGHSLHVAISALRRHLDRGGPSNRYVLFEDEQYGINPDAPIADDCRYFEQLCSSGDEYWQDGDRVHAQQAYTCALATYRGDYFVGNGDQSWALVQQQRLLARYLTTLDHLGQILMEQESYEAAIDVYLRLLQRDGYREDVHARVMRCYLSLGRRGAAIRQYESCVALLASELGLEPMAELKALYDLVTSGGDDATAAWDRTHPAPLAEGVAPPRPVPRRARS